MRLDTLQKNEVESLDEFDAIDYTIDPENMKYVYKAFINYSNPIGSIVREAVSNSFDAHVEAGTKEPVEVEIQDGNSLTGEPSAIIFRDFGIGISPERIKKIYSKFFSSTKRETNEQIGGYGVGAKVPLAYVSMFTLKTINEGVKYHYIIHRGEESPRIELLDREETDERSGSEIIVNMKPGDLDHFISEIKNQLVFFDNIRFINCRVTPQTTYRTKDFIWINETSTANSPRVCIGKVTYPIDQNVIDIKQILDDHVGYTVSVNRYISSYDYLNNIVLYFDIGEIDVVWNRESIEYNDRTIQAITDKIITVYEDLKQRIQKKQKVSYKDWLMSDSDAGKFSFDIGDNEVTISKTDNLLVRYLPKYMVTDYLEHLKFTKSVLMSARIHSKAHRNRISQNTHTDRIDKEDVINPGPYSGTVYILDGKASKVKTSYINQKIASRITIVKILSFSEFREAVEKAYYERTHEKKVPWEKDLKAIYDAEVEFLRRKCRVYDDVEVSQEFLEETKQKEEQDAQYLKERIPYLSINGDYGGTRNETTFKSFKEKSITKVGVFYNSDKKKQAILVFDNTKNRKYIKQVYKVYVKYYGNDLVKAISVNKAQADKIEALGYDNYVRAHKADKSKYTRRLANYMATAKYIQEEPSLQISLGGEWTRHRLFTDEMDRTIFKKLRFASASHSYDDLQRVKASIDEKVRHGLERNSGFKYKYPLLQYLHPDIPMEALEKISPKSPINPRLYYLKHKRQKEKLDETNSDS